MKILEDILLSVNCLDDFCCGARLVHGIDVDMIYAVFLQIPDLADGVINASLPHVFGIVALVAALVSVTTWSTVSILCI